MNEVKKAFLEALEKSADELQAVVGNQALPEDIRESYARLKHPDFGAKWTLAMMPDIIRGRAAPLRGGDLKKGDWPPFQPADASFAMETYERVIDEAKAESGNEVLLRSIRDAVTPLRNVVETYAEMTAEGWRFRQEDCDPMPEWSPPPAPGL